MPASLLRLTSASGSGPVSSIVFSTPASAGSALILSVYVNGSDQTPAPTLGTPTGGGVTWVSAPNNDPTRPSTWLTWYGVGSAGSAGPISVPVTGYFGNSAYVGLLCEFTGVSATLPQPDASTGNSGVGGSNPGDMLMPTPAGSTTRNEDLLFAIWIVPGNGVVTAGPTGGFAQLAQVRTTSHPGAETLEANMVAGYRPQTLAGGYAAQWTAPWTSARWYGHFLALKSPGLASALVGTSNGSSEDFAVLSAPSNIYVPPAVIAVPDRWLFGGVDLSTFAYTVTRSLGADSHPALRGDNPAWSGLPGRQHQEKVADSRIVTVEMYVHPMSPDGTDHSSVERTWARQNLDGLHAVLGLRSQQPLIRVMPDGTGRQASAEVWAVRELGDLAGAWGALFGLSVDFLLADPYFYGVSLVDSARAIPASFVLTNPGSLRTHRVLLEILGPATNPRITNSTNGVWVQYTGSVPNGQRLFIDSLAFSAYLSGANVVGNIDHAGARQFMVLEPGANSLIVTASGGALTTTFTPAYI